MEVLPRSTRLVAAMLVHLALALERHPLPSLLFAVMIMQLVDRKFNMQQGHQPISEAALDGQQGRGWKW